MRLPKAPCNCSRRVVFPLGISPQQNREGTNRQGGFDSFWIEVVVACNQLGAVAFCLPHLTNWLADYL